MSVLTTACTPDVRAWRISEHADLSGRGGRLAAARWNHRGDLIVYASEHPALALLEILVNVDAEDLPEDYQLIQIDIPDTLHPEDLTPEGNWRDDMSVTRNAWRSFCDNGTGAILRVPSVIMPCCFNLLINPSHPQAVDIRIVSTQRHLLDPRFRT